MSAFKREDLKEDDKITYDTLMERYVENQKDIIRLTNSNIDLQYSATLLFAKRFDEEEITYKPTKDSKETKTSKVRVMVFDQTFDDEETKEKITVERKKIIEIDGQRSDGYRLITPIKVE